MYKFLVIAAALAVANGAYLSGPAYAPAAYAAPTAYAAPAYAGYAHAPAALTSTSSNILRTPGNLGQVSTYSKTIDTPYSSVSKSDVRVSNPGYATYAAPAYAPAAYAAPAYHAPAAYAAPAYHAPAVVAAPAAYHAPAAYAAPAAYHAPAAYAAPVAHSGLVGVAYSAAPAVAHYSFDGVNLGHYGW